MARSCTDGHFPTDVGTLSSLAAPSAFQPRKQTAGFHETFCDLCAIWGHTNTTLCAIWGHTNTTLCILWPLCHLRTHQHHTLCHLRTHQHHTLCHLRTHQHHTLYSVTLVPFEDTPTPHFVLFRIMGEKVLGMRSSEVGETLKPLCIRAWTGVCRVGQIHIFADKWFAGR